MEKQWKIIIFNGTIIEITIVNGKTMEHHYF